MAKALTPMETCLAPLAKLALRFSDAQAAVIWGDAAGWEPQDDQTDQMDGEEIAFYAEGLLSEGFSLIWQALADPDDPTEVAQFLLFFWQGPIAPPPPPAQPGWLVTASGTWPTP